MRRVLVAGRIHNAGIAKLEGRDDVEAEFLTAPTATEVAARLRSADALIVRTTPVTATAIVGAPRLRIVARHGVGFDNVAVEALTVRGIPLAIVGSVNAVTVAEHCFAVMLALAKQLARHDTAMRRADWDLRESLASHELWQKTLLIVGFGRIGQEVAKRALAFDMRVVAYDPYVDGNFVASLGAEKADDLTAALPDADFVTLHAPRTAETDRLIGPDQLKLMREDALLINAARGGLIDEVALDQTLNAGGIAGAAIDVFEREPPDLENPLLRNDRVLLTPHNAGLTEECARRMALVCVDNVLGYFDGKLDPALVVNRDALQPRT